MLYGYAGKILRIDLSTGRVAAEPLSEELAQRFIGGRGFVAKTLFDEIPPGTAPFSPDNRFVIAAGPLSGHFMPASGKTHFGTKSPATGGYADSNLGGHFGPTLKYAGYDMMILTGRAEGPSYLFIDDDKVEIRSAEGYWGMGSLTLEKRMKEDLGEDFQILTIGPAGENLVRFACISHDFGRQAGRTGVGAVLGSKNIKAIAVRGSGSLPVFDVDAAFKEGKAAFQRIFKKPGFTGWTPEGTAGITDWTNEVGVFPTRNFQTSYSDHYKDINGKAILEQIKITDKGCYCCPTPCGKYGKADTALGSAFVEGPEFETIALFGGSCLLRSIHEVAYANYLCDELGLDTISGGAVVSWAVECMEKGILTEEQAGRKLAFGELETVDYLLRKIAARDGIGDLLAEGVKIAAEKTGGGSDHFAIHVKGLEWTGYESRNAPSMMLAYMTADVGAHHNRAWVLGHDVAGSATNVHDLITAGGKGEKLPKAPVTQDCADFVIESQNTRPLFDALGVCRLQFMELGFEAENYETLFYLITGRKLSWSDMLGISERIWQLTRAYSAREIAHFGRHLDLPPPRFYTDPIPTGPNEGHHVTREEVESLLGWYYQKRGWNDKGIPSRETLERAGLPEIAEALEAAGIYS